MKKKIISLQRTISKTNDDVNYNFKKFSNKALNIIENKCEEIDYNIQDYSERLFSLSCHLNFISGEIDFINKCYKTRENFLSLNKIDNFPDLIWTMNVHLEHILYIFNFKKGIDDFTHLDFIPYIYDDDSFDNKNNNDKLYNKDDIKFNDKLQKNMCIENINEIFKQYINRLYLDLNNK